MHNKFNKKLLLTLSILAYGLQVSGAHATRQLAEEETSINWNSIKSAATYTTAGVTTAVASVYAFGDKQEELVELKKQAVKGVISVGQSLWNNGTALYKLTRGAVSDFSQWASDTYMPYHPTVCHVASEGVRLVTDAYAAVEQTITEHPYVAAGVAVTFVAAVGITHMIHKSKTNKAEQLLAKEKQKIAKIQQELQEAQEEAKKAKQEALKATRFATKAADKLTELQEAQKTVGPTVVSPTTTIKPQTNIKPDVTIDGHNTSSPRARAVSGGGQGGNVTFNLVLPGTPETLSGFLPSMLQGKTPTTPLILGNTAIKTEG